MQLAGKAAVVTGASRGVGRATAIALAREGCAVLVNHSHSQAQAEKTVALVKQAGGRALAFQADVADDAACRRMMDAAHREFGRLDILVNNAGTTRFIPHQDLEAVTDTDWDRILGVNLKGPFQCARAARPFLEQSDDAAIVNVASVAGIVGNGSSIPYCASKAAVINLTISLARVLGPKIRVNAVAPGFIQGDWLKEGLGENYEAVKQAKEQQAALGKTCTPEDVAAAVMGFITGSRLVTGQTLLCDGGHSIGNSPTFVR